MGGGGKKPPQKIKSITPCFYITSYLTYCINWTIFFLVILEKVPGFNTPNPLPLYLGFLHRTGVWRSLGGGFIPMCGFMCRLIW